MKLKQTTRKLLRADKRTLLQIHKESGISLYFIKRFSADNIKEPSCDKVEALYEFLTGKQLAV